MVQWLSPRFQCRGGAWVQSLVTKRKKKNIWGLRVWLRPRASTVSCRFLQATLLGLAALNKAYPEVLAPRHGSSQLLPPPWPYPSLGLGMPGQVSPLEPRTQGSFSWRH